VDELLLSPEVAPLLLEGVDEELDEELSLGVLLVLPALGDGLSELMLPVLGALVPELMLPPLGGAPASPLDEDAPLPLAPDAPEELSPDELEPAIQQTEIARHLARYEVRPKLVYVLPAQRMLARRLTLPLAAEDNLRQVLGFELDRQTPFRADQVYFDQRVASRDPVAKQIQVELALTTRAALDADLDRLKAAGVELDAVDGPAPNGELLGMNLAPPERRAKRRDLRLRLNLALGAIVIALIGVVMAQSVSSREEALAKLRGEADKARRDAQAVADLRRTLTETVEGANFLNDRRQSKP